MTGSCVRRDHRLRLRRLGRDKEEMMSGLEAFADRAGTGVLRGEGAGAALTG